MSKSVHNEIHSECAGESVGKSTSKIVELGVYGLDKDSTLPMEKLKGLTERLCMRHFSTVTRG